MKTPLTSFLSSAVLASLFIITACQQPQQEASSTKESSKLPYDDPDFKGKIGRT